MTFPCDCLACGFVNQAEWSEVGRRIYCRSCGAAIVVPAPMEAVGPPPPAVVTFRCPSCNRKFASRADLAGKKIRCNRCGAGVRVPSADRVVGAGQPPLPGSSEADVLAPPALFEELVSAQGAGASGPVATVLPSRTEAMEEVRRLEEEKAEQTRQKKEALAKKKRKRKSEGYFDTKETLQLVAGVGALVAVLALVAWGYPDFRFPLGGILCVIGFIVYVMGLYSVRTLVREEGILPAILFRIFPPYQWWFVWTRWAETKDHVIFLAAGFVILSLGGAILKTSPVGLRAIAGDRAYEAARRGETNRPPMPPPVARPRERGE